MITLLLIQLFATTHMNNVWYQGMEGYQEMKGIVQETNMGGLIYLRDRSPVSITFEKKYLMDKDVKQFLAPFLKTVVQGADAKKILDEYGVKGLPAILIIKGRGGLVGQISTSDIMVSDFIYAVQQAMNRKVLILGSSSTKRSAQSSGKGLVLMKRLQLRRFRGRFYSQDQRDKAKRWVQQGNRALKNGQYSKAATFYRRATREQEESGSAYYGLAQSYLMAGIERRNLAYLRHGKHYSRQCTKYDPAHRGCKQSRIEADKGIARYYAFKGLALMEKKRCRQGTAFFKKSIKIKPNADAYYGMGECLARDGIKRRNKRIMRRARGYFKKALMFNPKHPDSQSGLIRLDQMMGR